MFIFFFHIPVTESIPNKDVLHINSKSTISGAGITSIVHHIHINRHTTQPANPHNLLLLNPLCAVSIFIKKLVHFIYFLYVIYN
nr:MAG TPA: hypothetical protein [Caudoviricetes sp.]